MRSKHDSEYEEREGLGLMAICPGDAVLVEM